ncbi:MAG: hypothetical protein WB785_23260 [Mycobacterium sp.]
MTTDSSYDRVGHAVQADHLVNSQAVAAFWDGLMKSLGLNGY